MEFYYRTKDKQGQMQKGVVEANNQAGAVNALEKRGLTVISVISAQEVPFYSKPLTFFQRIKSKDLVTFSRQLSILIEANVPLVEAIKSLQNQFKSSAFQSLVFQISADVEGGSSLSQALAKHPKAFSPLFVNVVKAGETSGTLRHSLIYLADYLEKQYDLKSKIKGALLYPIFVVCFLIAAGIVMLVWVIPKLTTLIEQSGGELPLPTKILIGSSDFIRSFWWLVIMLVVGLAVLVYFAFNTPAGRRAWDRFKIKVPIFGPLLKKMYMNRMADNLGTLIAGGIPIVRSIQTTAKVMNNKIYEDIMLTTANEVKSGSSVYEVFTRYEEIPTIVTQMISVGEKTGSTQESLENISNFYSREVDNTVNSLTQLLEPVIIVIMGIGVAIFVASILMPVYQVATSAGS